MTAIIASGDLSDGAKLNPAVKALHEQLLSIVKELPGGATKGTTRTISSGTIQIQNDVCIYPVDVEGGIASSDDLDFLTAATPADLRDGLIVGLAPLDANRNINVKHNTTGAGKFITRSGRDVLLRATNEFFWARYDSSASAWYQIEPDLSAELDRLVGARPVSTLTVSSSAITPDRAIHKITAAAPANLDLIAQTNYPIDQASVLIVTTAAASSAITVRHNQTGTGKILLRDSTDFVLPVGATLALYKDGTTWVEFDRTLGTEVHGPASVTDGRVCAFDGTTGKLLKQDTRLVADLVAGPATATDKAVALFNGATGKLLKDGIAPGASGNVLQSDGTNWTSAPLAGSAPYVSTDQAITDGGPLTLAHDLGVQPKNVWFALVCTSAEMNYSVGEVAYVPVSVTSMPLTIVPDATNLNVRYRDTVIFNLNDKTTGVSSSVTNSKWKVRFFAL